MDDGEAEEDYVTALERFGQVFGPSYRNNDSNHADGLRSEIYQIFQRAGLASYHSEVLRIGAVALSDRESALRDLFPIDETIPGLGQHNINERTESGTLTAVARIDDRDIFRPIQYVGMYLEGYPLEWLTRDIVTMSCLHVENSLKRQLKIDDRLSIGMILKRGKAQILDTELLDLLWKLNEAVYNKSKHSIERTNADGHMYSIADSLAVYLICRSLGSLILKDSGITTKYDELVFDEEIRVPPRQFSA